MKDKYQRILECFNWSEQQNSKYDSSMFWLSQFFFVLKKKKTHASRSEQFSKQINGKHGVMATFQWIIRSIT